MNPPLAPARLPAAQLLFARYLIGQIAESTWARIMETLDLEAASAEEREAIAEFYLHALRDLGSDGVKLPRPDEVADLLAAIRA